MIRADVDARRYIGREKDETINVMRRWLGLSQSVALRSYELVRPAISQDFNLDRAGLQKLIDMESEQGEALKITNPDSITDSKVLAEARRGDSIDPKLCARPFTSLLSDHANNNTIRKLDPASLPCEKVPIVPMENPSEVRPL